jgi:hypothetical protein
VSEPTSADKARTLLEKNTGSPIERAQVLATLAVAEAVDRLAEAVSRTETVEVVRYGAAAPVRLVPAEDDDL